MTKQQLISNIARAISRMEGYQLLNSVARKNNNPGNLRSWGKTPTRNGFAVFNRAEDGWSALYRQIENNIFGLGSKDPFRMRSVGLSLREFFQGQRDSEGKLILGGYPGYAPDSDNNQAEHYAKFVAESCGIDSIDTKLKTLITE